MYLYEEKVKVTARIHMKFFFSRRFTGNLSENLMKGY